MGMGHSWRCLKNHVVSEIGSRLPTGKVCSPGCGACSLSPTKQIFINAKFVLPPKFTRMRLVYEILRPAKIKEKVIPDKGPSPILFYLSLSHRHFPLVLSIHFVECQSVVVTCFPEEMEEEEGKRTKNFPLGVHPCIFPLAQRMHFQALCITRIEPGPLPG